MTATKLTRKCVEKIWGRRDLPDMFAGLGAGDEPLGEIWFEHPERRDAELLVKYLFTSEKLSIQVHPGDEAAVAAGFSRGKDEAWYLLSAEPDASIGIGLKREMMSAELASAASDGSIADLLDWRPGAAGDVYYSPAGTIHALGSGLSLIEIQQNSDVTYRLYDYGRPRELHVEAAVAVARPEPYRWRCTPHLLADGRTILAEGRAFVLEHWRGSRSGTLHPEEGRPVWLVPTAGGGEIAGAALEPGDVWLVDDECRFAVDEACELLVAYPDSGVIASLVR
jgi:mannose-6-phosphate isomerase